MPSNRLNDLEYFFGVASDQISRHGGFELEGVNA
jgi:hypothetical protein